MRETPAEDCSHQHRGISLLGDKEIESYVSPAASLRQSRQFHIVTNDDVYQMTGSCVASAQKMGTPYRQMQRKSQYNETIHAWGRHFRKKGR